MKQISLFLARLLLKLLCALGVLATFRIIGAGPFFPEMRAKLPLYAYVAVGIFACAFLAVSAHRASFRYNHSTLLLIFWLKHDLFENVATTLQSIPTDCSAIYPAAKLTDYDESDRSFTYQLENISITFAKEQEKSLYKSLAAPLQPFFSFFEEFNEKIYEPAADNSVFHIELKANSDTGCRLQIRLDSHKKWTLFYIPSQDSRLIEKHCFYRLKPLDNGWYIGIRG